MTVSVKQNEHDKVTRCTFSVDFKEIKTISQSLPSTYASGSGAREIRTFLSSLKNLSQSEDQKYPRLKTI